MAATAFLIVVTVVRFEGLVAWAFLFPGCCTTSSSQSLLWFFCFPKAPVLTQRGLFLVDQGQLSAKVGHQKCQCDGLISPAAVLLLREKILLLIIGRSVGILSCYVGSQKAQFFFLYWPFTFTDQVNFDPFFWLPYHKTILEFQYFFLRCCNSNILHLTLIYIVLNLTTNQYQARPLFIIHNLKKNIYTHVS